MTLLGRSPSLTRRTASFQMVSEVSWDKVRPSIRMFPYTNSTMKMCSLNYRPISKSDLDASLYARITEALGYSLAVGFISGFLADLREVVLAVGVLHMGQQLRAFAHQIHAAAKQVPARSHFWRIDIGHRQHTAT